MEEKYKNEAHKLFDNCSKNENIMLSIYVVNIIASRVLFLDDGRIVEEAPPADFFDHPQTERAQRFLRTFIFDAVAKQ